MRKQKFGKVIIFLLCLVLISLFEQFGNLNAFAGVNRSISSDSDRVAKLDSNGNLTFSLNAQVASTGTRWRTVGLYVTSDPTGRNGKESTKAKDCVFFDKLPKGCSKTDRVSANGVVVTKFIISKDVFNRMCDKAGVNLKTLQKNGGKVYIQGVLQGYKISKGGSKRNVTERCYTYKQMSNTRNTRRVNGSTWYGIGWPAICNEGWRARYDIAVEYKKVEAPVTINYYQSYEGKWKLVLSVTNSDDGKIEKNPATRNLNKANTGYQWSSTSGSGSIASGDRGLGLEKKYYISLSEIKTSSKSLPARLSGVGAGEGKTSNYYLYKTSVSKRKSKKNGAIRNKVAKTSAPIFKSCNFADKDGNLTDSYTKWLKTARQTFEVYNGGTVINVLYKKNSLKPKPDSHEDEDVISVEKLTPASTSAVIQSDKRDNEQFDSTQGIPTSETQYVNVFTDSYLYKYRFVRKYGKKQFNHYISCSHTDKHGKKLHDHDTELVWREYSYWKVDYLVIYRIESATVMNYSLPDEHVTIKPDASYNNVGNVSFMSCGRIGISPSDGWTVGQYIVMNDYLEFDGKIIMNADPVEKKTPTPGRIPESTQIDRDVLYLSDQLIEPEKSNGTFNSSGDVQFYPSFVYNTNIPDVDIEINPVNDVVIHTPTVCYPTITDAKEYTQLVTPGNCYHLVLDRYFTVNLPTSGYHSSLKGYGERDYAKYIRSREVKFPFEVYMCDGDDYTYYDADTWITLHQDSTKFYLPIWVNETAAVGIDFRARAINCDANDGLEMEEVCANADNTNYVAVDTKNAEVSGRLYNLNMYDYSDYPFWLDVFRKPKSLELKRFAYHVGFNNQNGEKVRSAFTLPTVDGSHPYMRNLGVLKPGYTSRMSLITIGNIYHGTDYVKIYPTFYYVSKKGNVNGSDITKLEEVDLYYNGTINGKYRNVVKVGSDLDKQNVKKMMLGNPYTGVTDEEFNQKAKIAGLKPKDIRSTTYDVYTYGEITIPSRMSTYIGMDCAPDEVIPDGVDPDRVTKSKQKWYFEYSLPSDVHAVKKGFDVTKYAHENGGIDYKEDFWKKDGYIVVNFEIVTFEAGFKNIQGDGDTGMGWMEGAEIFDKESETPIPHLTYTNRQNVDYGYCSMYKMEDQPLRKIDWHKAQFAFRYGDVLMYSLDGSAKKDYRSYGTH